VKHDLYIRSNYPVKRLEIYNPSGACILTDEAFIGKTSVAQLPEGIYFGRILVNDVVENKKIIIKK
jgi:hypothetical protein